jgi:hypothetical protein
MDRKPSTGRCLVLHRAVKPRDGYIVRHMAACDALELVCETGARKGSPLQALQVGIGDLLFDDRG